MKFSKLFMAIVAAFTTAFAACDNDTGFIGSAIMPEQDSLSTSQSAFLISSRSVETGPIVANTSNCFIGSIIDPDTRATTTSSFLAQFHLQEDYTLPKQDLLIKGEDGTIQADSCVIRIYHDKFYGDSLTTMKLTATDLSFDNIMMENTTYKTDINPDDYVNKSPLVKASATYTVLDQNLSSNDTDLASGNYRSIAVPLGKDYGTYILRAYYEHPEYFKNSYTFIHNVCPGFYVKHTGGVGTMINADVSTLDVYFRYQENDTTVANAWMRLAATQEVIQNTHVDHGIPAEMLDATNPYTFIKSPAGIHTELTLPLDKIIGSGVKALDPLCTGDYSGVHYQDTLNCARFTIRAFAGERQKDGGLDVPQYVMLIRKGEAAKTQKGESLSYAEDFFENKRLPDSETTYLCEYADKSSAYTYTNIAPLISYIRQQRDDEAGVTETDDELTRYAKWAEWEKAHPDWQTFELLPVKADFMTQSSYYGGTTKTLVGVQNDYNMHSVKLEGGDNSIQLNVIFSRFKSDEKK